MSRTELALLLLFFLVLFWPTPQQVAEERVVVVSQLELDIIERLGAPRDSLRLLLAWEQAEGADPACFNPLNTSLDMPGARTINSHGVKCYPDEATGLAATINTLAEDRYSGIVAAFQYTDDDAFLAALAASPWGTDADLVRKILDEQWTVTTGSMMAAGSKADIVPNWDQRINAGFWTVNCAYWSWQTGPAGKCQHLGTDIGGDGEGTRVYAPYSGTVVSCQDNGDGGSLVGWWLIYNTDNGAELLINHFRTVHDCTPGARVEAGQELGTMRSDANNVHVQVRVGGQLVDFVDFWNMN